MTPMRLLVVSTLKMDVPPAVCNCSAVVLFAAGLSQGAISPPNVGVAAVWMSCGADSVIVPSPSSATVTRFAVPAIQDDNALTLTSLSLPSLATRRLADSAVTDRSTSVSAPAAVLARIEAAAPGLLDVVTACVWSARASAAFVPTVPVLATVSVDAATFAVMACVWLPVLELVVAAVRVPGVVSATSSALTVIPAPAPTASVLSADKSPPPVNPAPDVIVRLVRTIVLGRSVSWIAANSAVVAPLARNTCPAVAPEMS